MNTFIITAGGIGKRMGKELPKQFILLHNKPILLHTLENIHQFDSDAEIIITLPNDWLNYWKEILHKYNCTIKHKIINGGSERYHSIKNALEHSNGTIISIHDGVRPLVSHTTIQKCINSAEKFGSGIPYLELKESIRRLTYENKSLALDRKEYVLVQTPQSFKSDIIKKAYTLPYRPDFTDDASVVQKAGFDIHLVRGNEENIKITHPVDLLLAEFYLG